MIGRNKKRHRTIEIADPDLGCSCVEVERAFLVYLGLHVRWRHDLDADFWCASKKDGFLFNLRTLLPEPCNVGCLYSIRGRNGAFGKGRAVREQALEESGQSSLATRVASCGWRTHENVAVPISLDSVGEFGEFWVSHELAPTGEIEAGLRLQIGELDGDRHEVKKSMNSPRKQREFRAPEEL